jgi:hypothetical protein
MEDLNRREFLHRGGQAAAWGAGAASGGSAAATPGVRISLAHDPEDTVARTPPARWAAGALRQGLEARGVSVGVHEGPGLPAGRTLCIYTSGGRSAPGQRVLQAGGTALPDAPEALELTQGRIDGRPVLLACGTDARGLAYALLELADRVEIAREPVAALALRRPVAERPANTVRSVARLFVSEVEDKPWFYDRAFWERYLSMLAALRYWFELRDGAGHARLWPGIDAGLMDPPYFTVREELAAPVDR